jgi:hypothetical protein
VSGGSTPGSVLFVSVALPDTAAWTSSVRLAGRMPPDSILVVVEKHMFQ